MGNTKSDRIRTLLLLMLCAFALASLCFAVKPVVYKLEKTIQFQNDTAEFVKEKETATHMSQIRREPLPYSQLHEDMVFYNRKLVYNRQKNLSSKSAYEASSFKLTDYGLPDEKFGIISIPIISLEMPLYLGASEENMANGAAVLTETSIPIGGSNTNAVIAGHRGFGGYKYFKDIDQLQIGDEVIITNIWDELHYTVSDIQVVTPNDVNAVLIQPDKDMITLLSCHPYASGGKFRYLVFCERVSDEGV